MKGRLMTQQTWFKWDYVCPDCDSNIEMTIKTNGRSHSETCPKCNGVLVLMSVVDVTIPSIQTKEDKMDTLIDPTLMPITNPAQQVSVFVDGGRVTKTLEEISADIVKYNNLIKELHNHNNKVFLVDNIISSRFEDSDDQDTLKEIATALGVSITKEISYTATISVSGNLLVDITEDYDLESLVYDNLAGNLYDVDFSIDNVDEDN